MSDIWSSQWTIYAPTSLGNPSPDTLPETHMASLLDCLNFLKSITTWVQTSQLHTQELLTGNPTLLCNCWPSVVSGTLISSLLHLAWLHNQLMWPNHAASCSLDYWTAAIAASMSLFAKIPFQGKTYTMSTTSSPKVTTTNQGMIPPILSGPP